MYTFSFLLHYMLLYMASSWYNIKITGFMNFLHWDAVVRSVSTFQVSLMIEVQ